MLNKIVSQTEDKSFAGKEQTPAVLDLHCSSVKQRARAPRAIADRHKIRQTYRQTMTK